MKIIEDRSFINIDAYARNVDENKKLDVSVKKESEGVFKEDKVELSSAANKIKEAKEIINSIPNIREQKIARIKTKIENGTYQIRGREIASNMLKESLINDLL
jgi:negative regulator of flagellin synthesis FlgM